MLPATHWLQITIIGARSGSPLTYEEYGKFVCIYFDRTSCHNFLFLITKMVAAHAD